MPLILMTADTEIGAPGDERCVALADSSGSAFRRRREAQAKAMRLRLPSLLSILLPLAVAVIVSGCGRSVAVPSVPGPEAGTPDSLVVVRSFFWDVPLIDPQPQWNPEQDLIVCRAPQGLAILREGSPPLMLATEEPWQPWEPRWITAQQLVYGPDPIPQTDSEGRVVVPNAGPVVVDLDGRRLARPRNLSDAGYRPRSWPPYIVTSLRDQVMRVDARGREEMIDIGFMPEPQPHGPGLTVQERPVFHADHWTGQSGLGRLIVRWGPGRTDLLSSGVQARWTPWGGLLATILLAAPERGRAWWEGGTNVVHLAGPGQTPQLIAADARDADPHPSAAVVAVTRHEGGIELVSLDGSTRRLIADVGRQPRFNRDGRLLMVEEPLPDGRRTRLRVHVLAQR